MRVQGIVAISQDPAMAERLGRALDATGGNVEVLGVREALDAKTFDCAVCVVHLAGSLADSARAILGRLGHGARIIYIVSRSDLAFMVELVALSDATIGILVAETLDDADVTTLARRAITRDIFGLGKLVADAAAVESRVLRDFKDRSRFLADLTAIVEGRNVPSRIATAIEQCADEMLMNALYDAPVDTEGVHVFADVPVETRVRERIDQEVLVEYAFDGDHFAISVRDAFGSLDRASVVRSLLKCLHSPDKIDRKAGGAGVGLFLMTKEATTVSFHVIPGLATEVICTFDVRADSPRLAELAVLIERDDVTGTLVSQRRPASQMQRVQVVAPPGRTGRLLAIGAGIFAAGAALAGIALLLRGRGPQLPSVPPIVWLDSQPSGASVYVDGTLVGDAPLTLKTLAPGADASVRFSRRGYKDATARVHVPGGGLFAMHVQPLAESPSFVRVHFHSTPPGARIVRTGASNLDRTYTPADVFVEANQPQNFVLTMPGHEPLVIASFTVQPGTGHLDMGGDLVPTPE